jgi:hypothetical protein
MFDVSTLTESLHLQLFTAQPAMVNSPAITNEYDQTILDPSGLRPGLLCPIRWL